jgi:hypothetical protein
MSSTDHEEVRSENFFATGPGNLRTCWGPSAPIYTASPSTQILRIVFGFNGNETRQFGAPPPGAMGWPFLSDGAVDEVDLQTRQTRRLKSNGPVWEPIYSPSAARSNCLYFILQFIP